MIITVPVFVGTSDRGDHNPDKEKKSFPVSGLMSSGSNGPRETNVKQRDDDIGRVFHYGMNFVQCYCPSI